MTNGEILKKAIEKAQANGFDNTNLVVVYHATGEYYKLIFSPEFAEAFWAKEKDKPKAFMNFSPAIVKSQPKQTVGWENHLQIMVLEKDPIKYLEQFL